MTLPLWAVVLFAAGMYPVGFILGSPCSDCCRCAGCVEGKLPQSLIATFSIPQSVTPISDLITVTASSCHGSGASGRATSPSGTFLDSYNDKGPLGAIEVVNGGSGYAIVGRTAPTLTISGGSGDGATFEPTLTQVQDECGIPHWELSSVSLTGSGSGYVDNELLAIAVASEDTQVSAAVARVQTSRTVPTLTPQVGIGSGAQFDITLQQVANVWTVASVDVTAGGSGYVDGSAFEVTLDDDDYGSGLAAVVWTERSLPTVSMSLLSSGGVDGLLTATLTQTTDYQGRTIWSVSSVAIDNAGTGYADYDPVMATVINGGTEGSAFYGFITVGENGEILSVSVVDGGAFWNDTGVIGSVSISYGGEYWHDDGVPTGVTVSQPGNFYRNDLSAEPYVADITVNITQVFPSEGTGAAVSAVVDTDTSSATFGQITAFEVDDGGDNYLAYEYLDSACLRILDGKSVRLERQGLASCDYVFECPAEDCRIERMRVEATYQNPALPMTLRVSNTWLPPNGRPTTPSYGYFTADSLTANCADVDVLMSRDPGMHSAPLGSTVHLRAGTSSSDNVCRIIGSKGTASLVATVEWAGETVIAESGEVTDPFCGGTPVNFSYSEDGLSFGFSLAWREPGTYQMNAPPGTICAIEPGWVFFGGGQRNREYPLENEFWYLNWQVPSDTRNPPADVTVGLGYSGEDIYAPVRSAKITISGTLP